MIDREQVYEDTYRDYASVVRRSLYKGITNRDDVDDIFQETFLGFWKALENFRGDAKPKSLLYTIAKRRLVDYLREKYKRFPDRQYIESLEKTNQVRIVPLNMLIACCEGETKDLLLAIKRTKERDS